MTLVAPRIGLAISVWISLSRSVPAAFKAASAVVAAEAPSFPEMAAADGTAATGLPASPAPRELANKRYRGPGPASIGGFRRGSREASHWATYCGSEPAIRFSLHITV